MTLKKVKNDIIQKGKEEKTKQTEIPQKNHAY